VPHGSADAPKHRSPEARRPTQIYTIGAILEIPGNSRSTCILLTMPPANLRFGGGPADSTILPLMAVSLLIACVLILTLPRQKAIVPFLVACFIIPLSQVVVLGSLHFSPIRILVLVALARRASFSRRDKYPGGFNTVDRAAILWSITAVVAFFLEFPRTAAVIQGLGILADTFGGYLAARFLIPDGETLRRAIKVLAVICVVEGVPMIAEQIIRINAFGYFAGVSVASALRDGSVRASGTMGALTAGPFAGALIPLFLWLWKARKSRKIAIAGLFGATAMVVTPNSSTPLLALGGSLVGLAFWPLRKQMRLVRWALLLTLIALHLVMKAPVWALIARIDLTGSSSSWQRFQLVDMTIRHFRDWWLIGTPNYVNWGWGSWDLCNQFAAVALTGGLVPLIFYIAIFKGSFGKIGTARKAVAGDRAKEWFLWCIGADLFSTFVSHWGMNYLGMLLMSLFVLLAMISVATSEARQPMAQKVETQDQEQFALAGSAV